MKKIFSEEDRSDSFVENREDESLPAPPPVLNLASNESWKNARINEALGILREDFSRIFVKVEEPKEVQTVIQA